MARKPAAKRRGATPRGKAGNTPKPPVAMVFAAGFLAGVISCLLGINAFTQDTNVDVVADAPEEPGRTQVKPKAEFEFHSILPAREDFIPDTETKPRQAEKPAGPYKSILQAGSFRKMDDADRMRAQLTLLGLETRLKTVKNQGDTWHRVQVGPFDNRSAFARARGTLIDHGYNPLTIPYDG